MFQGEPESIEEAILHRICEGVMLIAPDGTILLANPALESLFGYEHGSLAGRQVGLLELCSQEAPHRPLRNLLDEPGSDGASGTSLSGQRRDRTSCLLQGTFSSLQLGDRRCMMAILTDPSERKRLEIDLAQVATREMQRIGSDLHDGIGQLLVGIAMSLHSLAQKAANAERPALGAEAAAILGLVNAAISSSRSLARRLSPVHPSREGMVEALEELANQMWSAHRVRVKLELDLPPDLLIDESVATTFCRIAQEGAVNAACHADARSTRLCLRNAGHEMELLVVDDGKGFDPLQPTSGGIGLRIMQLQALQVGGLLTVESHPDSGTTLRCHRSGTASIGSVTLE